MRTIARWGIGLLMIGVAGGARAENGLAKRSVELTYQAKIEKLPEGAKVVDLWMPVAQDTEGQTVSRVEVKRPEGGAIAIEPRYGNKIWHKRFEAPFNAEGLGAELVFDIHRTEIVVDEAKSLAPVVKKKARSMTYLESNRLIPVYYDPVLKTAKELNLESEPPIRAARKVYDWLIEEFTYNYRAPGAGKGDVRWACDAKTGDCSDYHSMFLALMRGVGVPADHEFGFPLRTKNPEGRILSYHCWARFQVEGIGWIPLDASEADKHPELRDYNFGSQTADLLKFTHGRDVTLEPPQAGPPLNKFIYPYVEVDGKPLEEGVAWSVTYKEIAQATPGEKPRVRLNAPRIPPLPESEWTEGQKEMLATRKQPDGSLYNVYTTIVNHEDLFRSWIGFGAHILRNSTLPPRERELAILRIGYLCQAPYEWGHHVPIGKTAGLTDEEIERIKAGPAAAGWSAHDAAILRAVDELHTDAMISDATWAELSKKYEKKQMMDLVFTVGQYNLVSMALNSFGVQLEEGFKGFE
jgi:4-carboxymuconolactone decarboxylase